MKNVQNLGCEIV